MKERRIRLSYQPQDGPRWKAQDKNPGHPSDHPTREKTCLLHGPRHSSEECKVLKVYSENYAAQRPHKSIEACSGGNPKRGKVVEFDDNNQEVNTTENCGDPIPRKKKGTKVATKKHKIKIVKAGSSEKDVLMVLKALI